MQPVETVLRPLDTTGSFRTHQDLGDVIGGFPRRRVARAPGLLVEDAPVAPGKSEVAVERRNAVVFVVGERAAVIRRRLEESGEAAQVGVWRPVTEFS